MPIETPELLTIKQLTAALQQSEQWGYRAVREGLIPEKYVKRIGKNNRGIRVHRSYLEPQEAAADVQEVSS